MTLHGARFEGTVTHRRHDATGWSFRQPLGMPLLPLQDAARVLGRHPLASARRPAPLWLRRADHAGDPDRPLHEWVADTVHAHLGRRPTGPTLMLAHLRTWGWCFNPLSTHFAYDGDTLDAVVFEVHNTPWHERHAYVLDARAGRTADGDVVVGTAAKAMHVSPFQPMDLVYHARVRVPGDRVAVELDCRRDGSSVLTATVAMHRVGALDRAGLTHLLVHHPLRTYGVSAGIHREAWRLHRRGAIFRPHPARTRDDRARARVEVAG